MKLKVALSSFLPLAVGTASDGKLRGAWVAKGKLDWLDMKSQAATFL